MSLLFFRKITKSRFYRGRHGLLDFIDEIRDKLDDEMWFSITPQEVAKAHAAAFGRTPGLHLILDAFCGIGGDSLAMPESVFTVGTDIVQSSRLQLAQELTGRYAQGRCDFVRADFVRGRSCFRPSAFDAVYLSPPWGHDGVRKRTKAPVFGSRNLRSMTVDGETAFRRGLSLTKRDNIAFFLPRGMQEEELIRIADELTSAGKILFQVHESYDPDDETVPDKDKFKVRAITVYFGDLADVYETP